MSATASVRNKFYSEDETIKEGVGEYHDLLAEQKRKADRQSIVDGFNPRTGERLTLEEHQGALLRIEASSDEIQVYALRLEEERLQRIADDRELACWASSQYPCADCTHIMHADSADLNPAQQMLVELIR